MGTPALLRVLAGEAVDPAPVWLMRQAGRYLPEYRATRSQARDFLDLCFTPELAEEVTLQPIRRFGFDAAILFSDILVVPWALGRDVRFVEGVGPVMTALDGMAEAEALDVSAVSERLSPVFEAIGRLKRSLPADTPLIGFAGAPWTLATYVFGGKGSTDQAPTKLAAFGQPDVFAAVMARLERAIGDFLIAQIDAGVDAVKIFDSWAGAAPGDRLDDWVVAPLTRLTARIREERPGVPVMLFPRGIGGAAEAVAQSARPNALALDTNVQLSWARRRLAAALSLQGAIDPVLMRGPIDPLRRSLDEARAAMAGHPHILNFGHGITPEAQIENVSFLLEHWRRG